MRLYKLQPCFLKGSPQSLTCCLRQCAAEEITSCSVLVLHRHHSLSIKLNICYIILGKMETSRFVFIQRSEPICEFIWQVTETCLSKPLGNGIIDNTLLIKFLEKIYVEKVEIGDNVTDFSPTYIQLSFLIFLTLCSKRNNSIPTWSLWFMEVQ